MSNTDDRPTPTVPMFAHQSHIVVGASVCWAGMKCTIEAIHYNPTLMERRVDLIAGNASAKSINAKFVHPWIEEK
jgi:hypothetical protein